MELITIAEMDALPDSPAEAFVQLERICRNRMNEAVNNMGRDDSPDEVRMEYMTVVSAAARAYGVVDMETAFLDDEYSDHSFRRTYRKAVSEATRLGNEGRRLRSTESVALTDGAKARLRKHLGELESALESADLPDKRKKALKARLEAFAAELDRERSSLNKILTGIALVAAAINQTEDGVIKLPEAVAAVLTIVGKSKEEELQQAPPQSTLPAAASPKALPAPKPHASAFDTDLDDDVPF